MRVGISRYTATPQKGKKMNEREIKELHEEIFFTIKNEKFGGILDGVYVYDFWKEYALYCMAHDITALPSKAVSRRVAKLFGLHCESTGKAKRSTRYVKGAYIPRFRG